MMLSRPGWEFTVWSLRRATRQRATYVAIALLQLAILGVFLFWEYAQAFQSGPFWRGRQPDMGKVIFNSLHILNPLLIGLYTVITFGNSIAEYRTRGDASLIQLAWHSPRSFFTGCIAPQIWKVTTATLAQLPMVVLLWTWRGISVEFIVASYCVLSGLLIFLAGLATYFSASLPSSTSAVVAACVVAVILTLLPFVILLLTEFLLFHEWIHSHSLLHQYLAIVATWFANFSPFKIIALTNVNFIPWGVLIQFFCGSALLGLFYFRRAYQMVNGSFYSDFEFATHKRTLALKQPAPRLNKKKAHLLKRPGAAPVFWKMFHLEMNGWSGVNLSTTIVITYLFMSFFIHRFETKNWSLWNSPEFLSFTALGTFIVTVVFPILAYTESWKREKLNQTGTSLCLIPIPMSTLMWQKLQGTLPCMIPFAVTTGFMILILKDWPPAWFWLLTYVLFYVGLLLTTAWTAMRVSSRTSSFRKCVGYIFPVLTFAFLLWAFKDRPRVNGPLDLSQFTVHLCGLGTGIFIVLPLLYLLVGQIVRQMESWVTEGTDGQ